MDTWQVGQEILRKTREATWLGQDGTTTGDLLFTEVHQGAAPLDRARTLSNVPFAVLRYQGGQDDPDEPKLRRSTFEIMTVVDHEGDPRGSMGAAGGLRPTDGIDADLSSRGRGSREYLPQLKRVLCALGPGDGIELVEFHEAGGEDVDVKGRRVVASSATITVHHYDEATYPGVTRGLFGGSIMQWQNPALRFDFREPNLTVDPADPIEATIVVRGWKGGRPADPGPTDGTGVPLVVEPISEKTKPNTFSQFAVFVAYDVYENASLIRYSDSLLVPP